MDNGVYGMRYATLYCIVLWEKVALVNFLIGLFSSRGGC